MCLNYINPKFVWIILFVCLISCSSPVRYYTVSDFGKVPKIDAHFHYLTPDQRYMEFAISQNFRLLSPNWDWENTIDTQMIISSSILKSFPENFAFFGTFSVDSFNTPDFAGKTISRIKECFAAGATGIKIWKNIGMVLKDKNGKFVMIDDPAFEPVFQFLEENNIPVIGHLGEPKDCWLPYEKMTDPSDVKYYKENPQYYMFEHPDVPSYEEQINARDRMLKKHPKLDFTGAHLASLEWSTDELAKRLDSYPNLNVDLAARMYHLQYQSNIDREKVRDFMIKYQDRILYATDNEVYDVPGRDINTTLENLRKGWLAQWIYLATDSVRGQEGLNLPADVIDKIYFKNAAHYFKMNK